MTTRETMGFGEAYERSQDTPINPTANPTLGDVINIRLGRRTVLKGALATTAMTAALGPLALGARPAKGANLPAFAFDEISHGIDERHHVAAGYDADVLIRWGDPVLPGAPAFDPMNQTAAKQAMQFGYNCDFIGFAPLPAGSNNAAHGLLCVNHEYTQPEMMFPGVGGRRGSAEAAAAATREMVDVEIAAHGASIVEVRHGAGGTWQYNKESSYNRRITAATPMRIAGPAAGSDRMRTSADAEGRRVLGMVNNCAGGMTPWGTYLTGEENFHGYFQGELPAGHREAAGHKRYGIPSRWYSWGRHHPRFDVGREPNEANRFGWIVEIDPYDPQSMPVKRTALGRMKHEGAETIVNRDSRVVAYMGDDERFEYVYRFVSRGRFDPNNRAANRDLLDEGTLSVAWFHADGTLDWLPLVFGQGPLNAASGFASQADVLIEARRAADLLGATKMDRPEDVEPNRVTGKVYAILTNNASRKAEQVDKANPRAENLWGHIIEMTPPGGDHAADRYMWDMLLKAGDPRVAEVGAMYHAETSKNGWFACPDNCAFDSQGRLWVATDQGSAWKKASNNADGLYGVETEGPRRGLSKMFFRVPVGAELCGPCFAPDDTALFLAVQHPAADGTKDYEPFKRLSTFEDPATRWPDFKGDMPPRPSVVVVTRRGGGRIA